MVRVIQTHQPEITTDYVNLPDASARSVASNSCSGEHSEVTAATSGEIELL